MKYLFFNIGTFGVLLGLLCGCGLSGPSPGEIRALHAGAYEATGPYLTKDQHGNAVLCWTERSASDSLYRLRYALFDAKSSQFGEAVTIPVTAGISFSPESMNKIAFKSDGTVVALFSRHFEAEQNPYAGAIGYSLSADGGRTWSPQQYLHSDTSHAYGRSFYDMETLANGEVAAVWLDGRYGKADTGSALFFASTTKDGGFGRDTCIARSTCECCRTDLFANSDGRLHVAYRSVSHPAARMGRQVRDMVYRYSDNGGRTFSSAKPVSDDRWEIEGCPHTGPSLAGTGGKLHAFWFTAGGGAGLYYSHTTDAGDAFTRRSLISAAGRHPQMTSLSNGDLAMVWEEQQSPQSSHHSEAGGHHHGGAIPLAHGQAGASAIVLTLMKANGAQKQIRITDGKTACHHAVLSPVKDGLLVAWVQEDKNGTGIYYTRVNSL